MTVKKWLVPAGLWLPLISWIGLIYYLSSIPSLKTAPDPYWDEIIRSGAHLFFFGVLYYLSFRAFKFTRKKEDYWRGLVLSIGYGIFDEIHQHFVPTRTFQWQDLVMDLAGSLLGLMVVKLLIARMPQSLCRLAKKWTII